VTNLRSATRNELQRIKDLWGINNVEIISAAPERKKVQSYRRDIESTIVETISRRPCTLDDLTKILGIHVNEINKYLDVLDAEGKIEAINQERGLFYQIKRGNNFV
jgi:predicted Rossmann fold nucleotide-binding protein DprA/Smf involved in DNA uptake